HAVADQHSARAGVAERTLLCLGQNGKMPVCGADAPLPGQNAGRMGGMMQYDWNNMPAEQLNPQITRRVVHTENLTIARLQIAKDAVVPEHSHVNEQVATVERG